MSPTGLQEGQHKQRLNGENDTSKSWKCWCQQASTAFRLYPLHTDNKRLTPLHLPTNKNPAKSLKVQTTAFSVHVLVAITKSIEVPQ